VEGKEVKIPLEKGGKEEDHPFILVGRKKGRKKDAPRFN